MRHSKPPAKLSMVVLLPLLLLSYGVGNVHCATVHENSQDFHALLEFKNGIIDGNEVLNNWNPNTHFCRWYGVNCTLTRRLRVTQLQLSSKNLAGNISSSLGNLAFLDTLDLSNNSFYGPIPDALTNCSNLAYLYLNENHLTGVIPPRIGFLTNLKTVILDNNYLIGGIPAALGNITTLQLLSFTKNQLTGSIPQEVMQMPSLLALYLNLNNLSGEIPEVWQMPNILDLYLDQNNLSGRIPQNLSNMSSLRQLSLGFNMLGNTLPSNIGESLPNLTDLLLAHNHFEGRIPASLGTPPHLGDIDLSQNYFTGQIPNSLGNLKMLSYLNLEKNTLQSTENEGWEFLHALANCSSLNLLSVAYNKLQGYLPNSISNLSSTTLTKLIMSENSLSGIVPPSIGKLSALAQLSLDNNNLTGTIEEWIGKMVKLQRLNLQSNSFIGTIPPSIGHLTQLSYFSIAENQFTGFLPPDLGNLKSLSELHLSYNSFQGSIPLELGNIKGLTTLNISSNKFSGGIPETLDKFEQIYTIQMDQNNLTGNVPSTFRYLYTLSMLNLSHNNLSGPLQSFLNDLKSLTKLDISYNNLSGPLPAFLNNLELLTKVDLSYNNFKGEIPRNSLFENASIVSLNGNPGLCGGATDFHMRSCQVVSRRVGTIYNLFKTLIPIFGLMSLIMLTYVMFHWKKKTSRRPYLLLLSFGKQFPKVSYNDLVQATGNFCESNLIGRGSYGSVYKGKITLAKMQVAIKVFDLGMRCADRSFISECEVLRRIRHRNLLPILTACSTIDNNGNDFKALIYVFMQNGNLDTWLHHRPSSVASKRLGLIQRINIAVSIADALAYLHHDCGRLIVHCDLKPTNILLDDDMNAHLGDFGIASLVLDSRSTAGGHSGLNSSVAVTGTIGYIAPEYGQSVHASTCGDVYSFGIVLLEMVIGKRPTDPMFENELNIVSFVESNFPDKILGKIDACLQEECKCSIQAVPEVEQDIYRCLLSVVQVALSCTRLLPRERMNMREVAINMHAIRRSYIAAIASINRQ